MSAQTLIVSACWALLVLVWMVGALYNARRAPALKLRPRESRALLALIVAVVIIRVAIAARWRLPHDQSAWLRLPGLALLLLGTALALWARLALGRMWSASPALKHGHELRTGGPYALSRHPIYGGMLAMVLGSALAEGLGAWLVGFAFAVCWVAIRVHSEEQLLGELFPDDYPRYRQQVPLLLPRPRFRRGPGATRPRGTPGRPRRSRGSR